MHDWGKAPWHHIKGALKRSLCGWVPVGSVDDAEADWNNKLSIVVDNYVKWKTPATPGPTPWWNKHCEKAFHWKSKCFEHHMKEPEEYHRAVKFSRKVQKRAYGIYQKQVKSKLNNMSNSDGAFWKLAKEIGGIEADRAQSAPSAEVLAEHFADKMSNGKGVKDVGFIPKN